MKTVNDNSIEVPMESSIEASKKVVAPINCAQKKWLFTRLYEIMQTRLGLDSIEEQEKAQLYHDAEIIRATYHDLTLKANHHEALSNSV